VYAGPPGGAPDGVGRDAAVITSQAAAEISEEGAYASLRVERGVLQAALELRGTDEVGISSFFLRHPAVSFGFLERGDLIRLLDSPAGSWTRAAPASLWRPAGAGSGDAAPERYGIVVSPFPGPFPGSARLLSLAEPGLSLLGAHGLLTAGAFAGEALVLFSRTSRDPQVEEWLLERHTPYSDTATHGLFRLSFDVAPVELYGGCAVSASRYLAPEIAASSTLAVRLRRFEFSVTAGGGTRGYFGVGGKPVGVPFHVAYRLSAGRPSRAAAYLSHEVEIETLPLVRIPFRAADESLVLGFELQYRELSIGAEGDLCIQTERSGAQALSLEGDLAAKLDFPSGQMGIRTSVCLKPDAPAVFRIGVPARLDAGAFTLGLEAEFEGGEAPVVTGAFELAGEMKPGVRWHISAAAEIGNFTGPGGEKPYLTVHRYGAGWRVSRVVAPPL